MTGYPEESCKTTEVFDIDGGTCDNFPDYPVLADGVTAGLINDNILFSCGGNNPSQQFARHECYTITRDGIQESSTKLSVGKSYMASIVINDKYSNVKGNVSKLVKISSS